MFIILQLIKLYMNMADEEHINNRIFCESLYVH